MTRHGLGVLLGGSILLVLALKAPDVLLCGLGHAWWTARAAPAHVEVGTAARAAMLGGVAVRLLIAALVFAAIPMFGGSSVLDFAATLLRDGSRTAGLGILALGTLSLIEAFFLGVAVRLIGPSLAR